TPISTLVPYTTLFRSHSIWSTILSDAYAGQGGISIEGYEMLKGLSGVRTHEHREWLPILDNTQDMIGLARSVEETLKAFPGSHRSEEHTSELQSRFDL